ncbi:MAG: PhzF family phenazine biosynthesis protein [Acidiferrobacter sp.]
MTKIYMVDVFAEEQYSGNQLAVVIGSETLSDKTMQKIAAEINYSETTFVNITPEHDGGYPVRIFTPAREISFAGHPILGTAWVIRRYAAPDGGNTVRLNLPVGQVPVSFECSTDGSEIVWFLAPQMQLGTTCSPKAISVALGISPHDIETMVPVQKVTAGVSALIVPLRSLSALKNSMLDLHAFAPLAAQGFPPLVYLYCRETYDPRNDLCVRFFFEAHGVREDPATGNGAAFLGAYLLEHRLFGRLDLSLRIEQGHEVSRPSLIRMSARMTDISKEISIGGKVVPTMQGELL